MVWSEEILGKLSFAEREVCFSLELILRSHYQLELAEKSLIAARKAIEEAKELIVEVQKLLEEGSGG
jgi:hypothetical protein